MGCCFSGEDSDSPLVPPGTYDLSSIINLPVIFVSGVPGSGKQTISQTISHLTGYTMIRPSDLEEAEATKDTPRGRYVAEKLDNQEEIPEQLTVDLIKEAMLANQNSRGFILIGFPKSPRMSSLFNKQVKPPEKIVALEIDNEVAAARLQSKLSELGRPMEDLAARQIVQEAASKVRTVQKRLGASIIMVDNSGNPAELTASLKNLLAENLDHSQNPAADMHISASMPAP